jgi:hypothetical protein
LTWKDLLITFIPGALAVLTPFTYGVWREFYARNEFGPAAAETWSRPYYQLSAVALIALLWLGLLRVRRAHRKIQIYRKGLIIHSTWGRRWKLAWRSIDGIASKQVKNQFLGLSLGGNYSATLYPTTGKPIKLNRQIAGLEELCARVKAKIYPRLLRNYRTALNADETLQFGPIEFHQYGITWQQGIFSPKKASYSWDQINKVEVRDGFLVFEILNKSSRRFAVSKIPNIELFIQIIQEGISV